jgi:hypothetical protein
MKPFSGQFIECSKGGFHGKGSFDSFADHPELLPLFLSKKMRAAISSGQFKGIQHTACLRFGGDCNSAQPQCRELRQKNDPSCLSAITFGTIRHPRPSTHTSHTMSVDCAIHGLKFQRGCPACALVKREARRFTITARKLGNLYTFKKLVPSNRKQPAEYAVFLKIGVQSFRFAETFTKAEADWMRTMLGKALANLIAENQN